VRLPPSPSLRAGFLLILLMGAVVPLGIVGWWLTGTTRTSGEKLLRARLEQTADEIVRTVGTNWVGQRSTLLALAECEVVRRALAERHAVPPADSTRSPQLSRAWAAASPTVERVAFYDADGNLRGRLEADDGAARLGAAGAQPSVLPVRMPVYGRGAGARIGTM
jgi:hypothetical protein